MTKETLVDISNPATPATSEGKASRWATTFFGSHAPLLVRVVSLAIFFVAWELLGRSTESRILFAPISEVAIATIQFFQSAEFWAAFAATLQAFLIGLGAAIIVGTPVGIAIGYWRVAGVLAEPYLRWMLALPMSGLVPLIVLGFGFGVNARAFVVFLMAVLEVTANAYIGVRNVDRTLVEMGRSFAGKKTQLARTLILPAALPLVFAGIRLGTGKALIGMVIAELLLASQGIGLLLKRYSSRLLAAEVLALVLILLVFAALVMQLIEAIERRALRNYGLSYAD